MPPSSSIGAAIATVAIVLVVGAPAAAQDAGEGIRLGSFRVAPRVSVATAYDSNLFRTPEPRRKTLRVTLAPELLVTSDWRRHALRVGAGAEAAVHVEADDDNHLDAWLRSTAELDLTRRIRLGLSAELQRGHDPRASDEVPTGAAEPVRFTTFELQLRGQAEFGRLRLAPFAAWRRLNFEDVPLIGGGQADQDVRDRQELQAGLELDLAPGRGWAIVVRAGVFDIDYRRDRAGRARDAKGVSALGGVRLKLTELIEGRVTAGIVRHDYASPAFADVTTLAVDAGIDWYPSRQLRVQFEAGRRVAETAVAGAAGRIATTARLHLGYALRPTLTLGLGGQLSHDRYGGIARSDLGLDVGLDAAWSPRRGLTIGPEYRFVGARSNADGQGYAAHVLSLSATYRLGAQK